jgi:anti-sigma factor RsiW
MNVTREVILDLLPVYLAGEASPATRALVEEYLTRDPELGKEIRRNLAAVARPSLPPDLELRALRRTRGLLGLQRWVFGLAILFSLIPFSSAFTFRDRRLTEAYLLARDYPALAAVSLAIGNYVLGGLLPAPPPAADHDLAVWHHC